MSKTFIIIGLFVIVFITGCINGGGSEPQANNGLVVQEFTVEPDLVEPNEFVRFLFDVENVGGTTAHCVRSQIFGLDSWRNIDGQFLSYGGGYYSTNFNTFSTTSIAGNVCVSSNSCFSFAYSRGSGVPLSTFVGSVFTNLGRDVLCNRNYVINNPTLQSITQFKEDLRPPDPDKNRPGELFISDWTFVPPTLPEGQRATFPVTARAQYIYKTTATVNIPVVSKHEWKRRIDTGQPVDLPVTVSNANAPIKVAVLEGSSPIIVNTDPDIIAENPIQRETYRIELQNLGDGFPTPAEFTGGKLGGFIMGAVTLSGTGVNFDDCLGVGLSADYNRGLAPAPILGPSQTFSELLLGNNAEIIRMIKNRRAPFGCSIAIDRTAWAELPMGNILMTFDLYYQYNVDRSAVVTVKGTESGALPGGY